MNLSDDRSINAINPTKWDHYNGYNKPVNEYNVKAFVKPCRPEKEGVYINGHRARGYKVANLPLVYPPGKNPCVCDIRDVDKVEEVDTMHDTPVDVEAEERLLEDVLSNIGFAQLSEVDRDALRDDYFGRKTITR